MHRRDATSRGARGVACRCGARGARGPRTAPRAASSTQASRAVDRRWCPRSWFDGCAGAHAAAEAEKPREAAPKAATPAKARRRSREHDGEDAGGTIVPSPPTRSCCVARPRPSRRRRTHDGGGVERSGGAAHDRSADASRPARAGRASSSRLVRPTSTWAAAIARSCCRACCSAWSAARTRIRSSTPCPSRRRSAARTASRSCRPLTFADLSTGDMLVGSRSADRASSFSYVRSDLKALAASVELVWSLPLSRALEFELGLELGVGVTFGRLVDNWVYETADGPLDYGGRRFAPCRTVNDGVGCRPQDHGSPTPVRVGDYTRDGHVRGRRSTDAARRGCRYRSSACGCASRTTSRSASASAPPRPASGRARRWDMRSRAARRDVAQEGRAARGLPELAHEVSHGGRDAATVGVAVDVVVNVELASARGDRVHREERSVVRAVLAVGIVVRGRAHVHVEQRSLLGGEGVPVAGRERAGRVAAERPRGGARRVPGERSPRPAGRRHPGLERRPAWRANSSSLTPSRLTFVAVPSTGALGVVAVGAPSDVGVGSSMRPLQAARTRSRTGPMRSAAFMTIPSARVVPFRKRPQILGDCWRKSAMSGPSRRACVSPGTTASPVGVTASADRPADRRRPRDDDALGFIRERQRDGLNQSERDGGVGGDGR